MIKKLFKNKAKNNKKIMENLIAYMHFNEIFL